MKPKESIQTERGIGVQLIFDNDTEFSSDFTSHFLGKNESKRVFYLYLVTESKRVFYPYLVNESKRGFYPYLVNESKRVFYPYLVDKILGKACYKDKIVVVTRNEKIEMNLKGTLANINISDSSNSETDTRIFLRVFPAFSVA